MNQYHRLAAKRFLPGYYYATWPLRRLGLRFARAVGMCPITVVFYHRVSDRSVNPWTISNQDFRRQIEWLSAHFELISLGEAQRRLASGFNGKPAVCITFDDGYAENAEHALPLLIERRIPVTYFVATQYILNDTPFPHDVARGEPLSPNTAAQPRLFADSGIEIGAHTRTHADLGSLQSRDSLWYEIAGSREDLQQMLGQEVRYFAFPYGLYRNLSSVAAEMIRKAGFAGFCSAYGGYNFPRSDAFHLQRIHADPHWPRFQNWMSFDPRIALLVRRWNDTLAAAATEHSPIGTCVGALQVSGTALAAGSSLTEHSPIGTCVGALQMSSTALAAGSSLTEHSPIGTCVRTLQMSGTVLAAGGSLESPSKELVASTMPLTSITADGNDR